MTYDNARQFTIERQTRHRIKKRTPDENKIAIKW